MTDIELVASLAPHADDDQHLAASLTAILVRAYSQSLVSERCLAKVLQACSVMPSAVALLKAHPDLKTLLFYFLRYPNKDMKEPAMRLILATLEVSETEVAYLLQAVDCTNLKSRSLLELIYKMTCNSEANQTAAFRMGLTDQILSVVHK